MYNSSIKGQNFDFDGKLSHFIEVPHKVFFNDMSKDFWHDDFKDCDVVYSEIAWPYGYPRFNEKAGNKPNNYAQYMNNIERLINKLNVPAFIICGKNVARYFPDAKQYSFAITTSGTNMQGCTLYVWNYDYDNKHATTDQLIDFLAQNFKKCLDFSCGYGEHLLKFDDFVGCDINRKCLTYLSIILQEKLNDDSSSNGK